MSVFSFLRTLTPVFHGFGPLLALACLLCSPLPAQASSSLPGFTLEQLDTLLKSPEQPTLVVVMASWCGPCVEELPRINALYKEYTAKGVAVVGLSLDFNPYAMERLLKKLKVDFPFYWLGEKGITALNTAKVPLFLLLRPGQPTPRELGARNNAQLRKLFQTLSDN